MRDFEPEFVSDTTFGFIFPLLSIVVRGKTPSVLFVNCLVEQFHR